MALREFIDRTGCRWRVWDIRPEQMPAATRAEDHMQAILQGWLAFEPAGGGEKRRLSPIPARWESVTDAELDGMRERAEPVRVEEPARSPGTAGVSATIRTFRYPSGRYWTENELPSPSSASEKPLLRFTSGARELDAREWPSEWAGLSEDGLADLLYRSFPRDRTTENPTMNRRRRGDGA